MRSKNGPDAQAKGFHLQLGHFEHGIQGIVGLLLLLCIVLEARDDTGDGLAHDEDYRMIFKQEWMC